VTSEYTTTVNASIDMKSTISLLKINNNI